MRRTWVWLYLVMGIVGGVFGYFAPSWSCHGAELVCQAGCDDSTPHMVTYDHVRITGATKRANGTYSTEVDSGVLTHNGLTVTGQVQTSFGGRSMTTTFYSK